MTPFKNFSNDPRWRRRLRRGSLYVTIALALGAQSSCGNDGGNGNDWEQVTTYEVTKGVVTTLEETEPGRFVIVDERVVAHKDSSRVILKRLDGSTETLTLPSAKAFVQPADTFYQPATTQQHHHYGLGHIFWWSAMGHLMGRNFSTAPPAYLYRDARPTGTAFQASRAANDELRRTAVPRTELRPVKGRSGFFRSSRRGWGGA